MCILTNAFLNTIPSHAIKGRFNTSSKETDRNSALSLDGLIKSSENSPENAEKLTCILHYFDYWRERIQKGGDDRIGIDEGTSVKFIRKVEEYSLTKEDWIALDDISLCHFDVRDSGSIESTDGSLQADFANKFIGGGVLRHGCVQEEIRFVLSPECLVSMLICEEMDENEAILLQGTQQYSLYEGYSRSFKWKSSYKDKTSLIGNTRDNLLVALDAINYSRMNPDTQYDEKHILRDLNKCRAALTIWPSELSPTDESSEAREGVTRPFATGNWGCGAFRGDRGAVDCSFIGKTGHNLLYL